MTRPYAIRISRHTSGSLLGTARSWVAARVIFVGVLTNRWVIGGATTMIGLHLAFTYAPFMNALFHSAPITGEAWLRLGLAAVPSPQVGAWQRWPPACWRCSRFGS